MLAAVAILAASGVAGLPNIIMILSDDLGFGDYSISSPVNRSKATIPTPHIQSLADEGMKFTRSYSGPVCAPSRCTLMTGLHSGHCTIRGNDGAYSPLLPTDVTVAKALQGTYATALIGKWGLGNYGTHGYPLEQGFDYFVGQDSQVACHNWYPSVIQNGTVANWTVPANAAANLGAQCVGETPSCLWANDMYSSLATEYIRQRSQSQDGKPFFLYVAFTTPHSGSLKGWSETPYPVPYLYTQRFENEPWSEVLKDFAAAVSAQDDMVGTVLSTLRQTGLEEDTMVWFVGDNGPDDHPLDLFDDPGPFRGKKRSLHEGGIRQTLAVRWKGKIPPGSVSDEIVSFQDFLPTALDFAGLPPIQSDGVSFKSVLLNQSVHAPPRGYLYWEYCDLSEANGLLPQQYPPGWVQAVRFDDPPRQWKAIRSSKQHVYLYNLATDIAESYDLAASNPGVVQKAVSFMDASHTDSKYWPASDSPSQKCCNACYNPKGCPSPCAHNTK